jgi:uncharacterized protein
LLGWEYTDSPMAPGEVYTMFNLEGRNVAATYGMRAEQVAQGVPPNWLVYISVGNADATAARVASAGGTVMAPPFDVMEHGRMAVCADPTGAAFAIWEPRSHPGTGVGQKNGTVVWADLNSPDPARAAKFYSDVFGWTVVGGKDMRAVGPNDYGHIVNGEAMIGGIPPAAQHHPGAPAHWLIYFQVPDCDGVVSETIAEHGRVLVPPMTMEGVRRFAVLADSSGAAFAVVQTL